ncbi:hypothetical protein GCM10010171_07430 [Actinokineospora fastidiosa]|uniref:Uncharacterized protein n=2 Tax=Actinokineospora fastidiosa TaxID=1816 RepID=A0A918G529_9PSEU|nr:hypothetical protein GCM10010171_07430 [Actinokineospora fastidiosa]
MHITPTRRPRVARVGMAVLAAALVFGGTAAGTAVAETAPTAPSKAERADVLGKTADRAARVDARRLDTRAAAVAPENCRTRTNGDGVTMLRYAGANRYETAACASYWTWSDHNDPTEGVLKAKAVVLARGDAFPDALAGGPLAGYVDGPLLLTVPTRLLPNVKTEISRVLAPGGTVYLLGSTASLSDGINSELRAAGYATKRLAGSDRFGTAIRIAQEMRSTNLFFVTTGMNFPDALAAGTYAANYTLGATQAGQKPIAMLFTVDSRMPTSTMNFIDARAAEHGNELLLMTAGLSGDQAVRSAYPPQVVDSFVGKNRFETAAVIAESLFQDAEGLRGAGVGLANGMNFPDALAGTSMLMNYSQPLLLSTDTALPSATKVFLQSHAGEVVDPETGQPAAFLDVLGSEAVVSRSVATEALIAFS